MTEPLQFPATTPRLALPLLHAAQAQKEVTVNEALARIDVLLHGSVEGTATAPPTAPVDGTLWRVGAAATGAWSGHDGKLAWYHTGGWQFIVPWHGLQITDRTTGSVLRYVAGDWSQPVAPAPPAGGAVIDSEARNAIAAILAVLTTAGIASAT